MEESSLDWIRKLSPQATKWLSIALFGIAFVFVYLAQRTTPPTDVILIVLAILSGVTGFGLWLIYGEKVDRGPRR